MNDVGIVGTLCVTGLMLAVAVASTSAAEPYEIDGIVLGQSVTLDKILAPVPASMGSLD